MIVSCFPPSRGGVERTSYELALGLAEKGHSVTVVTSSRGRKAGNYVEQMGPLKVIRFAETRFLFDAPIVPKIAAAALTEDYDVLHVHGMTPSITDLAILFAKFRGKPVILTYHNDAQETFPSAMGRFAGALYSWLAIPIVGMADAIVSSTYSYASTSPVLRHVLGRVTVVPWGIAVARFAPKVSPEPHNHNIRVLFVGQLKKYKGVDVLLSSVAKLNEAGHPAELDIIGTGPHYDALRKHKEELKLDGNARFWGPVGDEALLEFYRYCDVVALPSLDRREAFGLVLLEAFASGKPAVTSNIPGVSEVASLGSGYLVEPNDPVLLADGIRRAIAGTPPPDAKWEEIAERLSTNKTVVKYESILRHAFERSKSWTFCLLIISSLGLLQATGNLDSQSISSAWGTLQN